MNTTISDTIKVWTEGFREGHNYCAVEGSSFSYTYASDEKSGTPDEEFFLEGFKAGYAAAFVIKEIKRVLADRDEANRLR